MNINNMKKICIIFASILITIGQCFGLIFTPNITVENDCELQKLYHFLINISCPNVQSKIIVKMNFGFEAEERKVFCSGNNNDKLHELLPDNIVGDHMKNIEIYGCSMPNILSLRNIMTKLSKEKPQRIKLMSQKIEFLNSSFWDGLTFDEVEINCKIHDLPKDFFTGFTSMQKLNLSGNELETLLKEIFANQTQLKILDLSGNELRKLPLRIFDSLCQLSTLDLSGNGLSEMPRAMFNNTKNLTILNLSRNNLKIITR